MAKRTVKRTGLARSKVAVESKKGRQVLIAPEITRAAARARTTNLIKGGYKTVKMQSVWQGKKGQGLKAGILGMAQTLQVDAETYAKLESMDPYKLARMYEDNDFIFEAFFQYEGINTTSQGVMVNEGAKADDVSLLIESYDRLFTP